MTTGVHLDPEARQFVEATSKPPFLRDLGPEKGRRAVEDVQSGPTKAPEANIEDRTIPGGPTGAVNIRIVRPQGATGALPVIVYTHGAGWVFGSEHTHDRLIREIAVGANAALVFTKYPLSPEARYPTAIEQIYTSLEWAAKSGSELGFDSRRIVLAGDSVGGNMTAAVAINAKNRRGPAAVGQLLFYPVTDASFDTGSYRQFAEGYFLRRDAMQWFWDQYLPDASKRSEITASPLRATTEQLKGLPPTLIITGEADVLRDEGEAYANKLRDAGVRVAAARFQGTIHDFVMLNALAQSAATRGAMTLAIAWLRERLGAK